jgi:hypothetical protein
MRSLIVCLACLSVAAAFGQRGGTRGASRRDADDRGAARQSRSFRGNAARSQLGGAILPAYVGGLYDGLYAPNLYPPQPNVTVVTPPAAPAPAPVQAPAQPPIIPMVKEYHWENTQVETAAREPVYFSIALRNGSVEQAEVFWIEGQTLCFINQHGKGRKVALDDVDEARSIRLNQERGIEFRLPG